MGLLTTKEPVYFKCREGAAGAGRIGFSFEPGAIYAWRGGRLPHTLQVYSENGVIEQLPGAPGIGFDICEITEAWFAAPRPEPKEPELLTLTDVLARLGWTIERLRDAIAMQSFPRCDLQSGGATASKPDQLPTEKWFVFTLEKWLAERATFDRGATK